MKKVFRFAAFDIFHARGFVQQFVLEYWKLQLCHANTHIGIFRR